LVCKYVEIVREKMSSVFEWVHHGVHDCLLSACNQHCRHTSLVC